MFTDSMLALHSSKMTGRKGWMAAMMEDEESTPSHNCTGRQTDRHTTTVDSVLPIKELATYSEESAKRLLYITIQTLW